MLETMFGLAAAATCGTHAYFFSRAFLMLSRGMSIDYGAAIPRRKQLLPKDQMRLQEAVGHILAKEKADVILWGETDHGDIRQMSFLADFHTLKMLAANGVKKIFIEDRIQNQPVLDAVAEGRAFEFASKGRHVLGDSFGGILNEVTTRLVKNATRHGIKIYAADPNNCRMTEFHLLNALAINNEAAFLGFVAPRMAQRYAAFGWRQFLRHRSDDRKVADFVKEKSDEGRSVIYRGAGHVYAVGEHSLRTLMPQALPISFAMSRKSQKELCQHGRHTGLSYRAPKYTLSLNTASIRRHEIG